MKLPFKIDLSGKTAVVTGGGGVLCSEFSKALAACGANVAVIDLRLDAAQKVADAITADGGAAIAVSANVLDKASLEAARDVILDRFGGVDILLNGAGGNNPKGTTDKEYFDQADIDPETAKGVKTFFDLDPEGVSFVFNLNFLGTLLPTQVFAREMLKRDKPVILNVSSMNAFRPLTKIPAYSGAKAAVSNFTQWLAVHFAQAGIRVNAIAPGFFVTNQNHDMLINPDGSLTPRSQKIIGHTPMGRFGEVSDLIGTVLWLVDNDASGFVTGVVVPIDGGFAAYSGV
ncbi:MAG: SDR family oxidoreductase [Clostridiales bacterium]|nr:SDR family oxidoreductase [Clostridiales bacterium]